VLALDKLSTDDQRDAVRTTALTLMTRFSTFHVMLDELYCWRHLDEKRLERIIWGDVAWNFKKKTVYQVEVAATCDTLASFFAAERGNYAIFPLEEDIPDSTVANYGERVARGHAETIDRGRGASYQAEAAELIAWSGHLIDKGWWLTPEERGERREARPPTPAPTTPQSTIGAINAAADPQEQPPQEIIIDPGRYPVCKELVDPRYAAWELGPDGSPDVFVHQYDVPYSTICATYPDISTRSEFQSLSGTGPATLLQITDVYTRTHHAVLVNGDFYKDPTPHKFPGGMPVVVELVSPFDYKGADGAFIRVGRPFCMHMMESCRQLSWILSAEATYMQRVLGLPIKHMGLKRNSMYLMPPDDPKNPYVYRPIVNRTPGGTGEYFPLEEGEDIEFMKPPPVSQATDQFAQRMSQNMSMLGFSPGILAGQAPAGTSGYGAYQITLATRARMEPVRVSFERFLARSIERDFRLMAYWWDIDNNTYALQRLSRQAGGARGAQISYDDVVNVGTVQVSINPRIKVASEQETTLMLQAHAQGVMSDYVLINLLAYAEDPDLEQKRIAFEMYARKDPTYQAALAKAYAEENNLPIPQSVEQQVADRMAQAQMAAQPQMAPQGQPGQAQPTPTLSPQQPGVSPSAGPGGGAAQVLAALQARQGQPA
jgi:hypothetical protein